MLMRNEREQIVKYGEAMSAARLSTGTSGNISIYNAELGLLAISPSGLDYFSTKPEDVVIAKLDGTVVDGTRKPSSELGLHAAFYREKPEIGAVVHTHSMYCTVFASLGQSVRAIHYVIADTGSAEVPCAPYHPYGTQELAEDAVRTCGEGKAVLLANHGLVTCGKDLSSAYSLACNMEYIAELQYRAMCIGQPNYLSDAQIADVIERFKSYGQPNSGKTGY